MRIANNVSALTAFNSLNASNNKLQKAIKRLSSGLRINSAADDAAGLAISEKMRSQISGLDAAIRNSQDGISFLQTAEGALNETNSMLQRMRELSVQAANDTLTANDRQYVQLEIDELKKQIDKISNTTQFNKKKILNGSSGAIWSSSDSSLKAIINGGLTYLDNFGQKVSTEGNYRIEIDAEGGQGQVLKTHVMPISAINYDKASWTEININAGVDTLGATEGEGWTFEDGLLTIEEDGVYSIFGTGQATTNHISIDDGVNATIFLRDVNIQTNGFAFNMSGATVDMYLKGENTLQCKGGIHGAGLQTSSGSRLTLSSASGDFSNAGSLLAIGSSHGAGIGGSCDAVGGGDNNAGTIIIKGGTIVAQGGTAAAGIGGGSFGGSVPGTYDEIRIDGGNIQAIGGMGGAGIGTAGDRGDSESANDGLIRILGGTIDARGGGIAGTGSSYAAGAGIGGGGTFSSGEIQIGNHASIDAAGYIEPGQTTSIGCGEYGEDRDVTYVSTPPPTARALPTIPGTSLNDKENLTLSEIPNFFNSEGISAVSDPKKLTITQGNGKSASITLYSMDTMEDVARKINDAIANTLGQGKYVSNANKFCTLSDGSAGSESIYEETSIYDKTGELKQQIFKSTMLIRSAVAGKAGELHFSGDESLLNALGLNTIQESQEAEYTASVFDAHSGKAVSMNVKATSSYFKNLISPNVDVEVDAMAGLISTWDERTNRFVISGTGTYSEVLHLKDNSTKFQIGANEGEDFLVQIGDASCDALGISAVNVLTRETASRAITMIDNAIDKISSQCAKVGSYENALEHTMSNLATASLNLTSAESRIRDADMAKEMMNLVKLQILTQAGTSMLTQANQFPNAVLSLIR